MRQGADTPGSASRLATRPAVRGNAAKKKPGLFPSRARDGAGFRLCSAHCKQSFHDWFKQDSPGDLLALGAGQPVLFRDGRAVTLAEAVSKCAHRQPENAGGFTALESPDVSGDAFACGLGPFGVI